MECRPIRSANFVRGDREINLSLANNIHAGFPTITFLTTFLLHTLMSWKRRLEMPSIYFFFFFNSHYSRTFDYNESSEALQFVEELREVQSSTNQLREEKV